MIYREVFGRKLSRLGFGAMRLPVKEGGEVDEALSIQMLRRAYESGINYFDTAWPYHGGKSELVIREALSIYPRESYCLADKYPGHQIMEKHDPAGIFEKQLEKCGTEYFDFYLLHNVCENSENTYNDERWNIIPYFIEQKRLGRIKHLGFSTHAGYDCLKRFLDKWGAELDFCQMQLNYVDWTLQNAKERYELLTERGLPVWVMEPLRGGKLVALPDVVKEKLEAAVPGRTPVEWAFGFLMRLDNVKVVLSGMSAPEQLEDNLRVFEKAMPLTDEETQSLLDAAKTLHGALPCTACRYCCDGCPQGLDIPTLLSYWNSLRFNPKDFTTVMAIETVPGDKLPSACIGCGACAQVCPQKIDIPAEMAKFAETYAGCTTWSEICRQRAEAERRLREGK